MQQSTLNHTLTLSFDEGFHIMEPAELDQYLIYDDQSRFGIADDSRHVAIAIIWNKPGALIRTVSSVRFALRGIETVLKKTSEKFKRLDYMKTNLCGQKALGFSYLYQAAGQERAGIAMVFKYQGYFYTIYYHARQSDGYSTHKVFSKILSSIKLAQ